ncbi:MAG: hypothetical protein Q8R28_04115 [Dehalococcoidia bacterium]|nr:hypothetical protein [Dehalococcoidia bacterium]
MSAHGLPDVDPIDVLEGLAGAVPCPDPPSFAGDFGCDLVSILFVAFYGIIALMGVVWWLVRKEEKERERKRAAFEEWLTGLEDTEEEELD